MHSKTHSPVKQLSQRRIEIKSGLQSEETPRNALHSCPHWSILLTKNFYVSLTECNLYQTMRFFWMGHILALCQLRNFSHTQLNLWLELVFLSDLL